MKAILLSVCCFFVALHITLGQDLTLSIPHKLAYEQEEVVLDILTLDFDSIVSAQFSVSWDPAIINFDNSETLDLDLVAVGEQSSDDGNLNISWFDIDGEGKKLNDGQVFLRLHFTAVGEIGDMSPVQINGDSLPIQIFKATTVPLVFDSIGLVIENGSVEIVDKDIPQSNFEITSSNVSDVACADDASGSIQIEANQSSVIYSWAGPGGFVSDLQNLENLLAGEYTLTVSDSIGTVLHESTYLIAQPLSSLTINEILTTASDCAEASGSAQIDVQGGTPPYIFALNDKAQFTSGAIQALSTGNYPLTITDNNGCSLTAEFNIAQLDSFSFSLGQDIEACLGQTVNLEAGQFSSYEWSQGSTEQNISIEDSGLYAVTVTNQAGCVATDTISINYIEDIQLQVAQENIIICPGDSIVLHVSGGVDYEWIDPTNELTDAQGGTALVHPNENTTYTVISEGECGADEIEIPVALHRIEATAGANMCVPVGESTRLGASGGEFYYWSGSEYPLSAYDIPNPSVTPEDSTQYFVMIIDQNQCTTFDTVIVFVADDPASFIPHINLISPNGDGQNDVLDFGDITKFGTNTFRIFNRWGKVVYEKINYQRDQERFGGVYNGKPLPAGNYYYVLSFINDKQIKQTLTIVRE